MHRNKRKYIRPDLVCHNIDKEICLVMTSEDTGPGDPFEPSATQSQEAGAAQQSSLQDNPFEENNLK